MNLPEILALVSRWLHIVPATILVGGALFMRFSLAPAVNESNASMEFRESVRRRWSRLVMVSVLFLLVSGLYNSAIKAIGYELSTFYNVLLLVKIVLAFAVFYLTSVLAGRSARAKRFREREVQWLNLLCALMVAIVLIGGYMKMDSANFQRKIKTADESAVSDPVIADQP